MYIADYIKSELPKWPNWFNRILLKFNVFGSLVYGKGYRKFAESISAISPEKKLLDMVNHAIKNVPYYREKYGTLEIKSLKEFEEKIGFIDKDEVMAHWDKFIADGTDMSKCMTGTTGGTSGKPLKLLFPKNRYLVSVPFFNKMLHEFGWNFDMVAVLRNHKLDEGRVCMINPMTKQVIFDAFRLSPEYVAKIYKVMRKYHIHYIHAYPSTLFQFCKFCHSLNLDLSFVKLCILTSEQITNEQMNFFVQTLHLPLNYSYGHSEKLIFAGNTPSSSNYVVEPAYGYAELVADDGSVIKKAHIQGQLTGTAFYNYNFPLIRYKTGDDASYSADIDPQQPFKKEFEQIAGRRQKTLIYCGNGQKVSITSLNVHNDLFDKTYGIQYVQEQKGELKVLIVKGEGYSANVEQRICDYLQMRLGAETKITIQYTDKLIHQPNGKFLLLISSVKE